jgi:hypothetical protein
LTEELKIYSYSEGHVTDGDVIDYLDAFYNNPQNRVIPIVCACGCFCKLKSVLMRRM